MNLKTILVIKSIFIVALISLVISCSQLKQEITTNQSKDTTINNTNNDESKKSLNRNTDFKNIKYTEVDIESAKKVTIDYYKNTVMKLENITHSYEIDIPDALYKDYNVHQIITFKVDISNSTKTPRKVFLGRKDTNNDWILLTQGA